MTSTNDCRRCRRPAASPATPRPSVETNLVRLCSAVALRPSSTLLTGQRPRYGPPTNEGPRCANTPALLVKPSRGALGTTSRTWDALARWPIRRRPRKPRTSGTAKNGKAFWRRSARMMPLFAGFLYVPIVARDRDTSRESAPSSRRGLGAALSQREVACPRKGILGRVAALASSSAVARGV